MNIPPKKINPVNDTPHISQCPTMSYMTLATLQHTQPSDLQFPGFPTALPTMVEGPKSAVEAIAKEPNDLASHSGFQSGSIQ